MAFSSFNSAEIVLIWFSIIETFGSSVAMASLNVHSNFRVATLALLNEIVVGFFQTPPFSLLAVFSTRDKKKNIKPILW